MLTRPIERVAFELEFVINSVEVRVVAATLGAGTPSCDSADADMEELMRACDCKSKSKSTIKSVSECAPHAYSSNRTRRI